MSPPRRRRSRAVAAAVVLAVLGPAAVACSDDHPRGTGGVTPLSAEQATVLANALFDDYDRGGARFEATLAAPGGRTLQLAGVVDWKAHTGRATVTANGIEPGLTEVVWDERTVLERRPALDPLVGAAGFASARWVARTPDVARRDLDRVVSVVAGLASPQRDNPLLIRQTAGSGKLRDEVVRGVPTQVLRYGTRNLFWLATDDGRLVSFSGTDAAGERPVRVEVLSHGTVTVTAPPAEQVVPVAQVQELYDAVRQAPG
jgi:hypothetical protein